MTDTWAIASGPEVVAPLGDHQRFVYVLAKGEERREVFVEIAGTAMASDYARLPSPLDDVVATQGRSVLEQQLGRTEPVAKVIVTTTSVRSVPRHGWYEAGDKLVVNENSVWLPCEFVETGEPADAEKIEDGRIMGGTYRRDVASVKLTSTGEVAWRRYELLRPEPPDRA